MSGRRTPSTDRPGGGAHARALELVLVVAAAAMVAAGGVVAWRATRTLPERPEFRVDPRRLELVRHPDWLDGPKGRSLLAGLMEAAPAPFSLLDAEGARALARSWETVGWVEGVSLERQFPDRYRVSLRLRRPEAWIEDRTGRRILLDGSGRVLPPPDLAPSQEEAYFASLPRIAGRLLEDGRAGDQVDDPAVAAAAAVAAEYRIGFLPLLSFPLPLREVDPANFEYRYLRDPRRAEFRVAVLAADGQAVVLEWGHAPGSDRWRRIPVEVKAEVAERIAARHPGFAGVASADLRVRNLWARWVRLRP